MPIARLCKLALTAGCAVLLSWPAPAQEAPRAFFAPPVRIQAGDAFVGAGRYYPSPVMHDVDGDGKLDIVVADLMGKVTVARRMGGQEGVRFEAEKPLLDRDGKPLKFHNW